MTQMYQNVRKTEENRTTIQPQNNRPKAKPLQFVDNRPEAKQQRELQRKVNSTINPVQKKSKEVIQMINRYKRSCWGDFWRSYIICCADTEDQMIKEVYNTALEDNKYLIINGNDDINYKNVIPAGIIPDTTPKISVFTNNSFSEKKSINVSSINKIEVGEKIVIDKCYEIRHISNDNENIAEVLRNKEYSIVLDKKNIYDPKMWDFSENKLKIDGEIVNFNFIERILIKFKDSDKLSKKKVNSPLRSILKDQNSARNNRNVRIKLENNRTYNFYPNEITDPITDQDNYDVTMDQDLNQSQVDNSQMPFGGNIIPLQIEDSPEIPAERNIDSQREVNNQRFNRMP